MRELSPDERMAFTRYVDRDKLIKLIDILAIRGTFDDDTTFIPDTGKTIPDSISAISYQTGSALYFSGEDNTLTYLEGRKGAAVDDHASIFMDTTIKSDDLQAHETE